MSLEDRPKEYAVEAVLLVYRRLDLDVSDSVQARHCSLLKKMFIQAMDEMNEVCATRMDEVFPSSYAADKIRELKIGEKMNGNS